MSLLEKIKSAPLDKVRSAHEKYLKALSLYEEVINDPSSVDEAVKKDAVEKRNSLIPLIDLVRLRYEELLSSTGNHVPGRESLIDSSKEPPKEPPKEPSKEPPKEPPKEPQKEPPKEPSKEPQKEHSKEPSIESPKEPSKEPSKDPQREPSKEPSKDPQREPSKEPPKEPSNETPNVEIPAVVTEELKKIRRLFYSSAVRQNHTNSTLQSHIQVLYAWALKKNKDPGDQEFSELLAALLSEMNEEPTELEENAHHDVAKPGEEGAPDDKDSMKKKTVVNEGDSTEERETVRSPEPSSGEQTQKDNGSTTDAEPPKSLYDHRIENTLRLLSVYPDKKFIREFLHLRKSSIEFGILEQSENVEKKAFLKEILLLIDLLMHDEPLSEVQKVHLRDGLEEISDLNLQDTPEDTQTVVRELSSTITSLLTVLDEEQQFEHLRNFGAHWLKLADYPEIRKKLISLERFMTPWSDEEDEEDLNNEEQSENETTSEPSPVVSALRKLHEEYPFVFFDKDDLLSASIADQRWYIREYSAEIEEKLNELIILCKTADTAEEKEIGEGLMRRKDVFETLRKGPEQTLFEVQHRLKDLLEGNIPLSKDVIEPLKDMVNLWPGSEHGTAVRGVIHDVDNLHILIETLQSNPNTRRVGQEYEIFERNCKEFGLLLLMKVEKKFGEEIDSKMDAETNHEELEAIDRIIENGMEIFGRYMEATSRDEIRNIEKRFSLNN
jgi:hypothetical protein